MVISLTSMTAVLCAFAATSAAADPADDVRTACSARDAKAVAALDGQDALFLPAGRDVIQGPEAIEAFFSGPFDMGVTGRKLELIEARGDDTRGKDAQGAG
ncbi:Cif family virulence factor [Paracoccus lichenicola]|uniref:hypothetical protein n=1 Tax=Paracoccus lichenicola TaxID=2665644 RepID=UPI001E4551A8|nr:hypothetical protein [Paracoccus lichenicola]